jgi:DNA-directed RNA polymerase specialized sigma subunit
MWRKFGHRMEDGIAEEDYLSTALCRALVPMTDKEMLCFVMHYICGVEQKHVGRALGGISQQAVSDNLRRAMRKASEEFAAMRAELA